uniref:Transposase n=1 Tax=Trichogramma kaykai TaxID=54128 RepID=A0ABD2WZ44_9HYME
MFGPAARCRTASVWPRPSQVYVCRMRVKCRVLLHRHKGLSLRLLVVVVDVFSGRLRELEGTSPSQGIMGGLRALVADKVTATTDYGRL